MENKKGRMNLPLKIAIIVICVILCVAVLATAVSLIARANRIYVFTPEKNIYYDMGIDELKSVLGEPYGKDTQSDVTPFNEYFFMETVYGYPAKSVYSFYDGVFSYSLSGAYFAIEIKDEAEAKRLFDEIHEELTGYYKTLSDYYREDFNSVSENHYSVRFGTDDGATGVKIELEYSNHVLSFYSYYLK